MNVICPISRMIALHFANQAKRDEVERFIMEINLAGYAPEDDEGWSGKGAVATVDGTTYSAVVTRENVVSRSAIELRTKISMTMKNDAYVLNGESLFIKVPEVIRITHERKFQNGQLMLSEILKASGLKDVKIIEIFNMGEYTSYKPKQMKFLSWARTESMMLKASRNN